ncbi:hypothetical protein [Maricaulis sp.]|uniref:DUF3108 domain-containing protein n=1 Tax=Maricaulis sp. TaxID=1486257 RepID=UPI002B27A425|nr:hypothetical protein [Maricaulis sp.]
MHKLCLAAVCAASFITLPAEGQSSDWRSRMDRDALAAGEIYLELQFEGEADGFMRLGWQVEGDEIAIYDRTMWASREIYETMEARIRLADLEPVSVDIRFHQGGQYFETAGTFEPGRVTGSTRLVRPGQPDTLHAIDTGLADGAILRASFFVLTAALPMELGEEVAFSWYAPMGNTTADITLRAVEAVVIETPAGTFNTHRIEQRGGTPANDIFVDRDTGRIVRIDIGGQPMRFVASATD